MLPAEFAHQPYFKVQELVPPKIYRSFGDSSLWFIDQQAFEVLLAIRELVDKPCVINNWHVGGTYTMSGFRTPKMTVGAKLSQHRFGRAFDMKFRDILNKDAYDTIVKSAEPLMALGLTTLEDLSMTATWIHMDCRWTGLDHILIVKP